MIDRKPSQAARRAELIETEGCLLCKARVHTERYYLRAKPNDMVYRESRQGDYMLCPWHSEMMEKDWFGDAPMLEGMIRSYLRAHR